MDMHMPLMDGFEATRRIRALPGGDGVKIVALTASAFKEQRKKIRTAGCDEVVNKPFRTHEIFETMAQHLGVRYRYGNAFPRPALAPVEVTAEVLADLPKELMEALRVAALSLSNEEFNGALDAVREQKPDLAEGLAGLAREFRFDRILELLDEGTGKKS